ncbi:MAG: PEP/pyruvate-binding domain-containing protein [Polyangiales bacterium]
MSVIDLHDPDARARSRSGGKGAELATRIATGLPVPEGFVVTTSEFTTFIDALDGATDSPEFGERIRAAPFPVALAVEVERWAQRSEARRWAVRSSAVSEDGEEASFAGQYETRLGVAAGDLRNAIQAVWSSAFSKRAIEYRLQRGISDVVMAVVVQEMVRADTAGVCFTAHPIHGESQLVIDANYGLGESVVSGWATPDTYVIDRVELATMTQALGDKRVRASLGVDGVEKLDVQPEERTRFCLEPTQVSEVARLALEVEQHHDGPVDIEWAYEEGALFLLQARRITVAGVANSCPPAGWHPANDTPIDPRYPLYSNGNISEVLPGCVTPLSWDHTGRLIERAFIAQLEALGAFGAETNPARILGFFYHRPYINVSLLLEAAHRTPGMTPDTILEEFVGKPDHATPALRISDLAPHRWPLLWRVVRAVVSHSRSLDARILECHRIAETDAVSFHESQVRRASDEALTSQVEMSEELATPSIVHVWASTLASVAFTQLRRRTATWLQDEDGALASSLVTGIEGLPSLEPALALHTLGDRIASDKKLARLFEEERGDQEVLTELQASSLAPEVARFIESYGHRGVAEAELSRPCWREDPTQLVSLLRNNLHPDATTPFDVRERQRRAHQAALQRLEPLSWWKRRWVTLLVQRAREGVLNRETMKDLVIRRLDRSRVIYRELNRRLLARNLLDRADDMFFLTWREVRDGLQGIVDGTLLASTVEARRRDYRWSQQVEVPKLQEGSPRRLRDSSIEVGSKGYLEGLGVSPGTVTGIARVVRDPRSDARIEPGEILVAPVTDVAWTPLFAQAAGLVVEVGGLLSHGSIVAREYGIPAVVGVPGATRAIRTGDWITLDGASGRVRKSTGPAATQAPPAPLEEPTNS